MSGYPDGIDSFQRKIDNIDTIIADDINSLQKAIENIETELGTNPSGSADDVAERLDNIEGQFSTLTLDDTRVDLSSGNVGSHSTLDQHVRDLNIHGNIESIAYNFPLMLDETMDQLFRGVLTSAFPLNAASADTSSSFILNAGDVVFCYPTAYPTSSGYRFCMVTQGTSGIEQEDLRLNGESSAPEFSDGSWITRIEPADTYSYDASTVNIKTGDLILAWPSSNPTASEYKWFMSTADAASASEIRLDGEASAPVFTANSRFSVVPPTATAPVTNDTMPIAEGDIVFCYPTSYPSASNYSWHIATTSASGPADTDLRLDGEASPPVFSNGSRFSKFITTGAAAVSDTQMPITCGEMLFCYTTSYPSGSSYQWHQVTVGALGAGNTDLRLDGENSAPVFAASSCISRYRSEKYQGVARGGEILELVHVPSGVTLNTKGTGTDPDSNGTCPPVYGNLSVKLPMPSDFSDNELSGQAMLMAGGSDPGTGTAMRNRIPIPYGTDDGYGPETGMRVELNTDAAARGIMGIKILNRSTFGDTNDGYPVIKAKTPKLSESMKWTCHLPLVAKVLDDNDNGQLVTGEYAVLVISSKGQSDSPGISTTCDECNAADIFKVPTAQIYTGNGQDGELIVDGTYAENNTDGFTHPGGKLSYPLNLQAEVIPSAGTLATGTYKYRVITVDPYGNESDGPGTLSVNVTSSGSAIRLTWNPVNGNNGYQVFGRTNGNEYLKRIYAESWTDDGADSQGGIRSDFTTDNTNGAYLIDTVKNYTNVTVQNQGVISCTPWNSGSKKYGKITFYATETVLINTGSKITVTGLGYKGGPLAPYSTTEPGYQGESYTGIGTRSRTANGGGGGAGGVCEGCSNKGGGAGFAETGGTYGGVYGEGGMPYGTPTLDILYRGSGGGAYLNQHTGGDGGGIIMIAANAITIQGNGLIESNGSPGSGTINTSNGGDGSGGSIYLKANNLNLGFGNVTALGGDKGCPNKGSKGRIRFDCINLGPSESDPPAYKFLMGT